MPLKLVLMLVLAMLLRQIYSDAPVYRTSAGAEAIACGLTGNCVPGSTDEAFMAIAGTAEFGALHEVPTPLTLANPLGAMTLFNCADGQPGRGYLIKAKMPSNKYLIVIQEWWGLNDHIKQEADKYFEALDGQVNVLAVDLYDGKVAATVDSAQKLIRAALGSHRKETILQGALELAGPGSQVYTVGWCFGGMMSLQTAIMGGAQVKGCIMYYGTPEKDAAKLAKINCDVLGIFGTQDRSIPNELVDAFASEMKAAGKNFTLLRYDAGHAFANPSNPGYNKQFGDDAFEKSIAFLKERL
jgi:carboxymethylenebutenolidase